jgi:hypothetical protein
MLSGERGCVRTAGRDRASPEGVRMHFRSYRRTAWAVLASFGLLAALASPAAAETKPLKANPDSVVTAKGQSVLIAVLKNDSGSNLVVSAIGSAPAHGEAEVVEGVKVRYTPSADFTGIDSFTYVVTDGTESATGAVTVTVKEKPALKESGAASEHSSQVTSTCEAYGSLDVAMSTLCSLYLGGTLPPWAKETIGQVIVKRVAEMQTAAVICAASGLDATLAGLCAVFTANTTPEWLQKELGKLIEKYAKHQSASVAAEKEKKKS